MTYRTLYLTRAATTRRPSKAGRVNAVGQSRMHVVCGHIPAAVKVRDRPPNRSTRAPSSGFAGRRAPTASQTGHGRSPRVPSARQPGENANAHRPREGDGRRNATWRRSHMAPPSSMCTLV